MSWILKHWGGGEYSDGKEGGCAVMGEEGECSQICALTLIFTGSLAGLTGVTSNILGERGNSCQISGRQVNLVVARSLYRGERREEDAGNRCIDSNPQSPQQP